jgi:hypothetical protein
MEVVKQLFRCCGWLFPTQVHSSVDEVVVFSLNLDAFFLDWVYVTIRLKSASYFLKLGSLGSILCFSYYHGMVLCQLPMESCELQEICQALRRHEGLIEGNNHSIQNVSRKIQEQDTNILAQLEVIMGILCNRGDILE